MLPERFELIYLDANASAKLRPEAARAMSKLILDDPIGRNPSSVHSSGQRARSELNQARSSILRLLGGGPELNANLVFTSGGTEACNSIVLGFLGTLPELCRYPAHIVTSSIEHSAIIEPIKVLEKAGWEVTYIDPLEDGKVSVEIFSAAIKENTALVCLMAANNETAVIQPVVELAQTLRKNSFSGVIVSDASQLLGKSEVILADYFMAGVNAISISSHKIGGPPGIGALVINPSTDGLCFSFEPMFRGGPQEGRLRAGTENVLAAVGFGAAAEAVLSNGAAEVKRISSLREVLWGELLALNLPVVRVAPKVPAESTTENATASLSNTLLLRFPGCRGDDLVVALDLMGVQASTGSACSSGKQSASHVPLALGFSSEEARELIRFSLDWDATLEQVSQAVEIIASVVRRMSTVPEYQNLHVTY